MKYFLKIWNDPVWSKVISVGIIGLISYIVTNVTYSPVIKTLIYKKLPNFSDVNVNLISLFFTILVFYFLFLISRKILQPNNVFSGQWKQLIFNEKGDIIKEDVVTLKQSGKNITGQIKRVNPIIEKSKRWQLSGQIHDDFLLAFYTSKQNISKGTIQMLKTSETEFSGFYIKSWTEVKNQEILEKRLIKSLIRWEKIA